MIVDAHAHVDRYGDRLEEALRQMQERRILTVGVSMDSESYRATKKAAARSRLLVATFGVHPWQAPQYSHRLSELDAFLQETPLIGEAGLDYHWVTDRASFPAQRAVFEYQCGWAARLGKPMNLHTKGAEEDVLRCLRGYAVPASIVHWYSGPANLVESYLAEGSYFTIGVEVLLSQPIQEIARAVPLERLLLETDNPGGYEWLTGQVGMPELIAKVQSRVAAIKGLDEPELEERLWQNWLSLTGGLKSDVRDL